MQPMIAIRSHTHAAGGRVLAGALLGLFLGANVPAASAGLAAGTPDLLVEGLTSSDVNVWNATLGDRWDAAGGEGGVSVGWADLLVDYRPSLVELIGTDARLNDRRTSLQADWHSKATPLAPFLSLGGYHGFTDFRSMWIDEYYRQLFAGTVGYHEADPRGLNVGTGVRWDYLPGTGFLEFNGGWANDWVAPAYDKIIFGPLLEGPVSLATWQGGVVWEAVLAPRLRGRVEVGLSKTTDLAHRLNGRALLNYALAQSWVLRLEASGAAEAGFHGGSLGTTLEYDRNDRWFYGVSVRWYRDNGQVAELPASTVQAGAALGGSGSAISLAEVDDGVAPPLRTLEGLGTVRWQGARIGWRVSAGPYRTAYTFPDSAESLFANLYRNRTWAMVQTAGTLTW